MAAKWLPFLFDCGSRSLRGFCRQKTCRWHVFRQNACSGYAARAAGFRRKAALPLLRPRRRGLRIARNDFFQKSSLIHCAPFPSQPQKSPILSVRTSVFSSFYCVVFGMEKWYSITAKTVDINSPLHRQTRRHEWIDSRRFHHGKGIPKPAHGRSS